MTLFFVRLKLKADPQQYSPIYNIGKVSAPILFVNGDHDDLMDSTTQALLRFRQGSFIKHPEDYKDEKQSKEKKIYY